MSPNIQCEDEAIRLIIKEWVDLKNNLSEKEWLLTVAESSCDRYRQALKNIVKEIQGICPPEGWDKTSVQTIAEEALCEPE